MNKPQRNLVAMAALTLLTVAVLATPAEAKKKKKKKTLEGIELVWKPTTELGELGPVNLTDLLDAEIRIGEFTDSRDNPELIGENREDEDEGVIKKVTTPDDIAGWVADRVGYVFEQVGYPMVDEGGTTVIKGEIKRFFVTETNLYNSDIGVLITVETADGKSLWRGMAGGAATRFGRSYKADNYYEVLSDALLEAIHELAANKEFREACAGKN